MKISGLDTGIASIQLGNIFEINAIFKRRGREVISVGEEDKLLFFCGNLAMLHMAEKYYDALESGSFRRVVSCVADSKKALSFSNVCAEYTDLEEKQVKDYLKRAVNLGFIAEEGGNYKRTKPTGFGPTFEWFVAKVCEKELASIAYWGVQVEGLEGDYDVVLVRENQIGYIECKSGKQKNITRDHIKHFLDRERALAPYFSIFVADGVSRDRLDGLVKYALSTENCYEFEIPGAMTITKTLRQENYKNFVRLVPINSFFISTEDSLKKVLLEIYRFLTTVTDRRLLAENQSAKQVFK